MNFIDRTSLGDTFAQRLERFHGKDAVIVCLQESSLLTCLTAASQIRAWVFPLLYEPVYTPDHAHRLLGAFDQDGNFCAVSDSFALPETPAHKKKVTSETGKIIQKQKTEAMKAIEKRTAGYGLAPDKQLLNGRDVILMGDILTTPLPLIVAQQVLKGATPTSLTAMIGNATAEVAELVRMSAGETDILDVLSGIHFDDDHYFEHTDTYTPEQKQTLTQHIAAYWQ